MRLQVLNKNNYHNKLFDLDACILELLNTKYFVILFHTLMADLNTCTFRKLNVE